MCKCNNMKDLRVIRGIWSTLRRADIWALYQIRSKVSCPYLVCTAPAAVLLSSSLLLHRRAFFTLQIRSDLQPERQLLPGVQLHQRFQNLGVHMFRRLVRPDILFPQNAPHESRGPEFNTSQVPSWELP